MKITLLDGQTYDKEDLVKQADNDDFYYNYLGKYSFSSSSLKHLLSSPKTYKHILEYGQPDAQAFIEKVTITKSDNLQHALLTIKDISGSFIANREVELPKGSTLVKEVTHDII